MKKSVESNRLLQSKVKPVVTLTNRLVSPDLKISDRRRKKVATLADKVLKSLISQVKINEDASIKEFCRSVIFEQLSSVTNQINDLNLVLSSKLQLMEIREAEMSVAFKNIRQQV